MIGRLARKWQRVNVADKAASLVRVLVELMLCVVILAGLIAAAALALNAAAAGPGSAFDAVLLLLGSILALALSGGAWWILWRLA